MHLSRLTLPSKHCRNATFKKIFIFPPVRISLAVLPPFLRGCGGKSQTLNQRQVLMQGSAQWFVRGFGVSLRLSGHHLSVSVHPAPMSAASHLCPQITSLLGLKKHWKEKRARSVGVRRRKKPPDLQVCRELPPLALQSEGGLGFPNLPSQAVPKAARQGRVILNNWDLRLKVSSTCWTAAEMSKIQGGFKN